MKGKDIALAETTVICSQQFAMMSCDTYDNDT